MNLISKIVVSAVTINLIGLALVSYKVMGKDLKNKAKQMMSESAKNTLISSESDSSGTSEKKQVTDQGNIVKIPLKGIDVSHWNGSIIEDLPKKDNLKFVICKSTQGEVDVDPDFEKNWKYLEDNNIMKGAYHFYDYTQNPVRQAEHFCKTVGKVKETDFPLIIDVEELSLPRKAIDIERLKADLIEFLNFVENETHRKPIIYSDFSFINRYLKDPVFGNYPLWLAEYSHSQKPKLPEHWKKKGCLIWQKTDRYHVNSTESDFDIYYKEEG